MAVSQGFFELVSGRRGGLLGGAARAALSPLSAGYRGAVALRNAWYDLGLTVSRAGVPVVSVGNITTGGTGKTPMTAWVADALAGMGRRVGILLRGYGARAAEVEAETVGGAPAAVNDEAALLRRLCPWATVVTGADRVASARRARRAGCDALVLDDGFQHRRIHRDADVVLIDATQPLGFGRLLPCGLLREPAAALRRASVVVLTRAEQVPDGELEALRERISCLSRGRPVLSARTEVEGWYDLQGRRIEGVDAGALDALLFAGVANFEAVRRTVESLGVQVRSACRFRDHHAYTEDEMARLAHLAREIEVNAVVTTEKDAVKLIGRWTGGEPQVLVPRIRMAFAAADEAALRDLLRGCLSG